MRMLVPAAVLIALTLTACGGSDDSGEGSAEPSTTPETEISAPATSAAATPTPAPSESAEAPEAALEASYRTYIKAFLTGDGAAAYELLSERCKAEMPLSEFAEVTETAADLYGLVDYTIESVEVDGKRGTLDATYPVEALNQGGGSVWVLEGDEWRSDKCN